ncbi:TonB-dependent receptor domain-containing protein [Hyphococcus sp.]|uniref:TonB-dependent receptor domain-containing protein n=1 Tax=Hyphococcus sp. TaxID=2038636 RepID=UPI0020852117|nr:MAG: TonB-dependent receptor [Marinicaulis sp.]
MSRKLIAGRFLRTTMLSGVAAAVAMPAFAQDGDDTIVVTGSRIARTDLAAPSPVARVDAEQLVLTNTVNSEQFLNTLPQVIPAFDSTSNNPGNGTATVNLRGLGTNRTLVLVDGARYVASGPGGVVDINAIPSALVERVEVLTGGASAIYGSDAVAGVVNFILKDDFEGIQLDVSDEMSAAGWDANIFNAALTMGGNFADGRGNAIMSLSYTNREALFQGDRPGSANTLFDPGVGGGSEFLTGGSGNAEGGQFISLGTNDFSASYPCVDAPPQICSGNVTFGGAVPTAGGRRYVNPQDQYNYAPANYLQLPQERYSIYAGGAYEINDSMEVYARGIFAQSVVATELAATPVGGTFTIGLDNPNLPPEFAAAIAAAYTGAGEISDLDGDGEVDDVNIFFARRYNDEALGPRNSNRDTSSFQLQTGIRGDLSPSWSYDAFLQFGRSQGSRTQSGNISFSALQAGVTDGTCDVFGINTLSQACGTAISRTGIINSTVEQTQFVGTINGTIDGLVFPWAEEAVGLAVGVEYREEFADFAPDSVLGPDVRGFNASLPTNGRYDVYEAFMETRIPIVQGVQGIEELAINGAYRYSDYSSIGGTHTFSAGLEWVPVEGLRFRGQFQRAARAPNIGELFGAFTNGFPGAQDPCSGGAFGGGDGQAAICTAYGVPAAAVGTSFQLSGQIEALFGGNPNLFEETSDTLTIGAVWQPASIDGLVMQVDYYDITIDDAIQGVPLQLLLDQCYVTGDTSICDTFFGPGTRSPATGRIGAPFLPMIGGLNIAGFAARGIDFQINYGFDLGNIGSVSMVYYGNYTLESSFQNTPTQPVIDCVGTFAGNCGEPTPTYKHTMQTSLVSGPLTTSVRWRLIGGTVIDPSVFPAGQTTIGDLSDNLDMANYVDVTMRYAVNENLDLTVGVQNILGKDAPLLGSTVNEQANTWPATYETLGRQLFVGASVRF